jgi:hypothetical protein
LSPSSILHSHLSSGVLTRRIKRLLKPPPLLKLLLDFPVAFLGLYTHLCLSTPHHLYPFWAFLMFAVNGWLEAGNAAPKDVNVWPEVRLVTVDHCMILK